MACVPQYLSDVHTNPSRGSGQFVPTMHSAIEHLTRSRRNCRTPESFSCRFLSWPVRERPPACLYAISARAVSRMTRSAPRLHTPSNGSLSAMPAAIPAGVAGSGPSTHAPLCVPYAAERPSARRKWRSSVPRRAESPLVISFLTAPNHDVNVFQFEQRFALAVDKQGDVTQTKIARKTQPRFSAAALTYLCRRYILRVWTVCGD